MLAQELVDEAREQAFLPNSTDFTDDYILLQVNRCLRMELVPAIIRANAEYFTELLDVAPDSQGYVRLPYAAVASTARVITWVDDSGREFAPLVQLSIADIHMQNGYPGVGGGSPETFSPLPDGIQVYGSWDVGKCRVRYSRQPSKLILPVASPANIWTLSVPVQNGAGTFWVSTPTVLPGMTNSLPTGLLDITDALSPHRLIAGSLSVVSGHIVVAPVDGGAGDALAARVLAGSYLTAAGKAPMPQCAIEWHDLLLYYSAARLAGLRKDFALKSDILTDAGPILSNLLNQAAPRMPNNAKIISAFRGHRRVGGRIL